MAADQEHNRTPDRAASQRFGNPPAADMSWLPLVLGIGGLAVLIMLMHPGRNDPNSPSPRIERPSVPTTLPANRPATPTPAPQN